MMFITVTNTMGMVIGAKNEIISDGRSTFIRRDKRIIELTPGSHIANKSKRK